MFSKATHPVEKAYWLAKDISSDYSLNLVLGHNLEFTKDMFSIFSCLETEMEDQTKENQKLVG